MEGALSSVVHAVWRNGHRRPVGAVLALLLLAASCAHPSSGLPATTTTAAAMVDPPRRGKPLLLVAMPDLESYRTVRRSLLGELEADFDIVTKVTTAQSSPEEFARDLRAIAPVCVVLMNNPTVNLYRRYQAGLPAGGKPIPAVIVMASFLEQLRADLTNATGVAFEVPGVSAFVSLRSITVSPVRRVGLIHRPTFKSFVERQAALAAEERIVLVPAPVPENPVADDVRSAVAVLRRSKVDALWVLNDNRLIADGEMREAMAELGTPIIVGVPALLSSQAKFGTLAVLPDLDALGVQTANLVVDLAENGWNARVHPVELPLSTLTVVNMTQMRGRFGIKAGAITTSIDRQIE